MDFVHLHVHSEFSMLDSSIRVTDMVKQAKLLGMPALALTDHNNMHATVQFHKACKDAGIKPITGCEVNFTFGDPTDPQNKQSTHLVILAKSQEGYHNLNRIVSEGWVYGRPYPRIGLKTLTKYKKDIVVLTACMGGALAQEVLIRGKDAGRNALTKLREATDEIFVEVQDHGFEEQAPLNLILSELALEVGLKLVATNDCHYLEAKHAHAQKVLQCVASGLSLQEMNGIHHGSSELYFKDTASMHRAFSMYPDAPRNTMLVAEICAGMCTPFAKPKLPRFVSDQNETEESALERLAKQGLSARLSVLSQRAIKFNEKEYEARIDFEIKMIQQMGFSGYFLIVADFINWAKSQHIPVGPGRGSGAGSVVAWALNITDLDPITHGLLFERFLNPERVSMPDFDIDFCMDRRDEVIDYVKGKYGAHSVGQIATFHQLKSKSVVRDVGRVLGFTPTDAGRIAGFIPNPVQGKTVSIEDALTEEPRLKAMVDQDSTVKELVDTAQMLEDLNRHAGMHAAGVVISEGPLWDHVPVFCPIPDVYVTQYHKDDVESAGLVKFDFLGLKTLTVIDVAAKMVNNRRRFEQEHMGQSSDAFSIDAIPLKDKSTYTLLQTGETTNVFQLESQGMQQLFKQLKPDVFEDIVAAVALYRPGPLGTGMVSDFVQRKHGRVKLEYPHPMLEPILKDTYGVIVYQEQVMQIARTMAGYTLGGADLLRRAMGKKKAEEMAQQREIFVKGATENQVQPSKAGEIFDLLEFFAGYGFNKSHSAAYALITYQTAYLKAHYPVEFICAALTADKDKTDKVVRTVADARVMGITVMPPDVNESGINFNVVYAKPTAEAAEAIQKSRKSGTPVSYKGKLRDALSPKIRFGLGGIKGLGEAAVQAIFEAREEGGPFVDLYDFTCRVDLRRVSKSSIEALIQSGAFDGVHDALGVSRSSGYLAIEPALDQGRKVHAERISGQGNLFSLLGDADTTSISSKNHPPFPKIAPWDSKETLAREKLALGFYISGHPIERYAQELRRLSNASTVSLTRDDDGREVTLGGTVESYRERPTKTGGKIAFFDLEDGVGRMEVVVRPAKVESCRELLSKGDPVLVHGKVKFEESDSEDDLPKLILDTCEPLLTAIQTKTSLVSIELFVEDLNDEKIKVLHQTLMLSPGRCPVHLTLKSRAEKWSLEIKELPLKVDPSEHLLSNMEKLFGQKVCELM